MAYTVGQVLFVVPKQGKAQIVPVQVVEEITKKTLQGEIVSHMVKVGKDGKVVDVSQVDGEVFDSSVVAKRTLTERSAKSIALIVDQAVSLALVWYPGAQEIANKSPEPLDLGPSLTDDGSDDGDISAVLEDGTRVRVVLPDSLK